MADVKVRVIGEDQASKEIAKTDKALGGLKDKARMSVGSLTELTSAFSLAERGIRMLQEGLDATVGETVRYNKSIRELTQVTGTGAEEISRIVQVADDWGISIDQVRTALSMMNKNGVTPSIDNLAALADEYVNNADKTVFAEKAAKLLGRQYTTLIPLFAQGGDALRIATAAVDDSLVATDKSIKMARQYEMVLDAVNDRILALKMSIGNELIPEIINLLPITKESVDWNTKQIKVQKGVERVYAEVAGQLRDVTGLYNSLTPAEQALLIVNEQLNTSIGTTEEILYDYRYIVTDVDHEASRAAQAVENFAGGVDKVTKAVEEAEPKTKGFLDGINRNIASPIANFIKDLEWMSATGGVIEQAFGDIQKALDAHEITPEQAKAFAGELLVAAKDVEVTLDPTKLKDAAADLEDTLGKAAAKVAMEDIKGTNGLEGALTEVTRVQRYLDFTFRYHGTPPSAYGGGSGYGTGAGLGGGGGAEGGTGDAKPKDTTPPPEHGRAFGGPVFGGQAYNVNEAQSEWLYMPKGKSGFVVPENQMPTGGGGDTIIEINLVGAPSMTPEQVNSIIARNLSVVARNMRAGGYARGR